MHKKGEIIIRPDLCIKAKTLVKKIRDKYFLEGRNGGVYFPVVIDFNVDYIMYDGNGRYLYHYIVDNGNDEYIRCIVNLENV